MTARQFYKQAFILFYRLLRCLHFLIVQTLSVLTTYDWRQKDQWELKFGPEL